ncbi:MFS transporter [Providencia hangzhouensis]|uniref:MFS transporter n=1 Tax=Providencia rettgeri TaxID=587 RepID=A0AAJ4NJS2_PRORE|nr:MULTISPECIES: MFS transporter [Providencia]MBJ9972905.1 MFS transporter [Providencia rettgeri]MCF8963708.1 Multidrug resistance protein MdtH [Providencia rettgeri]QWQ16997.1 MFS transporter [Providencia rettgeri]QWQ20831.1 MFS transporter [Providencia rettgeri]QWQ24666.1 MFS transporter [Providencia rettgeri]
MNLLKSHLIIGFLFGIQIVSMGAMEMSGPFWPIHLQHNSSGWLLSFSLTMVYVAPMTGVMLTSTFWGRMGDRMGNKAMMIRALLGLAITQILLSFCNDPWLILLLRTVQGACAGYIAPAQAYGVSVTDPKKRTQLFAFLQVSTNIGSLLGALCGGLILDYLNFFWINIIAGLLCGVCAVTVFVFLPSDKKHHLVIQAKKTSNNKKKYRPQQVVKHLMLLMGLLLMSRMLTLPSFSLYLNHSYSIDFWVIGLIYGLQAMGVILSAQLWAKWFEHQSITVSLVRLKWIIFTCVIVVICLALTPIIFWFASLYLLWGVLLGATTPILTALISSTTSSEHQGYVLGLSQSINQFASIGGIALGSIFILFPGIDWLFYYVSAGYITSLITIILLIKHSSNEELYERKA